MAKFIRWPLCGLSILGMIAGLVGGCQQATPLQPQTPSRPQTTTSAKLPPNRDNAPQQEPAHGQSASAPSSPARPATAETIDYGHSVKGRSLTATVMGEGPNTTIVFGAFHGNEPSTPGVVREIQEYLKRHPEMLIGRRVVLAPVVNPDGLAKGTRVNARGVDLNRNFSHGWKPTSKGPNYFPGKSAESEPETRAVIALMRRYPPQKVISIHQPYHCMNYTGAAGRELASLMRRYNRYRITDDIGYPTPGSFGDYCGKKLGIAIVTLEMPSQSVSAGWEANRDALLAAIKHQVS